MAILMAKRYSSTTVEIFDPCSPGPGCRVSVPDSARSELLAHPPEAREDPSDRRPPDRPLYDAFGTSMGISNRVSSASSSSSSTAVVESASEPSLSYPPSPGVSRRPSRASSSTSSRRTPALVSPPAALSPPRVPPSCPPTPTPTAGRCPCRLPPSSRSSSLRTSLSLPPSQPARAVTLAAVGGGVIVRLGAAHDPAVGASAVQDAGRAAENPGGCALGDVAGGGFPVPDARGERRKLFEGESGGGGAPKEHATYLGSLLCTPALPTSALPTSPAPHNL